MPPKRRVALQSVPLAAAAAPALQSTTLPSQKTWETMMANLERKYVPPRKKSPRRRRRKPSKKARKVYQRQLGGMTRGRKTTALEKTLLALMTAYPGNASTVKVWPKRLSLCSAVCWAPGAKKKLATFL